MNKIETASRAFALGAIALIGCRPQAETEIPAALVFQTLKENVEKQFPEFNTEQRRTYLEVLSDLENRIGEDTKMTMQDGAFLSEQIGHSFMVDQFRDSGTPSQRTSRSVF